MATKATKKMPAANGASKKAPARKPAAAMAKAAAATLPDPATAGAQAAAKTRKPKLVRDSFTIPRDEYAAIDALKVRAARLGRIIKKSELLRAGLKALVASDDAALMGTLAVVPAIKTGRPKGKRGKDGALSGAPPATRRA
jgi:hypothetical protein